jgi:CRISPR-associated protein Cas2
MIYLYCYDIANPRRLRRIGKRLEQLGLRTQKSIFQCEASKEVHQRIIGELRSSINRKVDSLRIYPVCRDCLEAVEFDGDQPMIDTVEYVIV